MTWKPTTAQIELILQFGGAGWGTDRIAATLGVPCDDLVAYGTRLQMGRSLALAKAGVVKEGDEPVKYSGPGWRFHE